MVEKEVKIIEDKQEIDKIIEEKIKGRKLVFTNWYKEGLLKKGDIGYEIFYKMSNNTLFSIGTIPKENNLLIIHLIEYKRSLDYRFKKFKNL